MNHSMNYTTVLLDNIQGKNKERSSDTSSTQLNIVQVHVAA